MTVEADLAQMSEYANMVKSLSAVRKKKKKKRKKFESNGLISQNIER